MIIEHGILNLGRGEILTITYEAHFWVFMCLNLILIAMAKTLNQNYIGTLFSTAIINRQLLQKVQDELKLGSVSSVLLTFTYFINLALLINYFATQEYSRQTFVLIGILLVGALIKWGAMWLLRFIVQYRAGITEHGMNHLVYYQVSGIILTPILIFSHFLPASTYMHVVVLCLILSGLLLVFREIQSVGRAFKARISSLYIILYLCTLELMPLVLIIYAFVINFTGLN